MKAYCETCRAHQPASFRPGKDAKTGEPYEDLCCDACHYVIASVAERVPADRAAMRDEAKRLLRQLPAGALRPTLDRLVEPIINLVDALALAPSAPRGQAALPPLDDDLRRILGRPNFACIQLANDLRAVGFEIARKSEHEQAAVAHYLLGFYLTHGAQWADAASEDMQRRVAALSAAQTAQPQQGSADVQS